MCPHPSPGECSCTPFAFSVIRIIRAGIGRALCASSHHEPCPKRIKKKTDHETNAVTRIRRIANGVRFAMSDIPRQCGGSAKLDFESLVLAHYEALYRFAFALTRSEPEALFDHTGRPGRLVLAPRSGRRHQPGARLRFVECQLLLPAPLLPLLGVGFGAVNPALAADAPTPVRAASGAGQRPGRRAGRRSQAAQGG